MFELSVLRRQIPALARAIACTEALAQTSSGSSAEVLLSDIARMRCQLVDIDNELWKTPLYPCHCGRRLSGCPNQVGSMKCNLADKGA